MGHDPLYKFKDKGGDTMTDAPVTQETKSSSGISWLGVAVGVVLGGALFLATIQIVKILMYSLSAA